MNQGGGQTYDYDAGLIIPTPLILRVFYAWLNSHSTISLKLSRHTDQTYSVLSIFGHGA
jgi:hypothetical protein